MGIIKSKFKVQSLLRMRGNAWFLMMYAYTCSGPGVGHSNIGLPGLNVALAHGSAYCGEGAWLFILVKKQLDVDFGTSAKQPRPFPACGQFRGVRHGASRRTRFRNPLDFKWISDFRMDFGFQNGFLDFKVDFWISKWISGFQSGFLDFKVDFWISKRISGFQSGFLEGFLDFKRISGFQSGFLDFKVDFSRDFWVSSEFLDFKADFWISFEPLLIRYS